MPIPKAFYFPDDGTFLNSPFPLLMQRQVFTGEKEKIAGTMRQHFASNGWTNA